MFAGLAAIIFMLFGGWIVYQAWNDHNGKMGVVGLIIFAFGALGAGNL